MVLGLRSRHKKAASFQVEYIVHVEEIKPWPPSNFLRLPQALLLHWESGDKNSGLLTSGVGSSNIIFNESFILPLTLYYEKKAQEKFQKNYLEFHLYEQGNNKASRDQLLGTALINIADYGVIEESLALSIPFNCKKGSKNSEQPVLYIQIQPLHKSSSGSSPLLSFPELASLNNNLDKSVDSLVNEANGKESERGVSLGGDGSSHLLEHVSSSTSEAASLSLSEEDKNGVGLVKEKARSQQGELTILNPTGNLLPALSNDSSSAMLRHASLNASHSTFSEGSMTSIRKKSTSPLLESSLSLMSKRSAHQKSEDSTQNIVKEGTAYEMDDETMNIKGKVQGNIQKSTKKKANDPVAKVNHSETYLQVDMRSERRDSMDSPSQLSQGRKQCQDETTETHNMDINLVTGKGKKNHLYPQQDKHMLQRELVDELFQDSDRSDSMLKSETFNLNKRISGAEGSSRTSEKLKQVKSVNYNLTDRKWHASDGQIAEKARKPRNEFTDGKQKKESRSKLLEEELKEAAALEISLYSIVAEHGSSANKVHAPARRLARFYHHASKSKTHGKKASAARAAVSGLILVSKACGNDVPRLTFWLSNCIMLRANVNQTVMGMQPSDGPCLEISGRREAGGTLSKKHEKPYSTEKSNNGMVEDFGDWEDTETFSTALEKVEAWIFSRIVESVWWQAMTPHMQCAVASITGKSTNSPPKKHRGSKCDLRSLGQGNFSTELWKKAFKDACERLCPTRAGGHECGCLPVLARLVMEQLVSRLDVAMFNAILRESAEEMPTDPVSDPISDPNVLPIPAGRSSFGAGVQLKNAIGTWSRWLSDLFDIEDNDSPEEVDTFAHSRPESFKAFRLLNSLSDLMMLPFEMLADAETRKDVCPIFTPSLIKRVLNNFVPDEFSPKPVPVTILDVLDSVDAADATGESLADYPCTAGPISYSPPTTASISISLGDLGNQVLRRSGSSVIRKSYTSDDELDELDSPLTLIMRESLRASPNQAKSICPGQGKGGRKVLRYELLREAWKDDLC